MIGNVVYKCLISFYSKNFFNYLSLLKNILGFHNKFVFKYRNIGCKNKSYFEWVLSTY